MCNMDHRYTAKKNHRHILTSGPDDAGPNSQADGKCVQQTCWTFLYAMSSKSEKSCSVLYPGR